MTRYFFLFLFIVLSTGCAHNQLKFNTTKHSGTLTDIYEQQVLDNLARFVENPETVPHFELPSSGGTNVNDTAGFSAGPLNTFRREFGLAGNRTQLNAWILQPVTDPDRLRRIQCAFQRAVGYQSPSCKDCCELEKSFIDSPPISVGSVFDETGKRRVDPVTEEPYPNVTSLDEVIEYDQFGRSLGNKINVYRPVSSGDGDPANPVLAKRRRVDDDGAEMNDVVYYMEYSQGVVQEITRTPYDCHSPCAVQSCCYKVASTRRSARSYGGGRFGEHRGTFVWVPQCRRAEFGNLVFTVLEYATTDPAAQPTKEVTLYLDHAGEPSDPKSASQVIRRTVPASAGNIAVEEGKIAAKPDANEQSSVAASKLLKVIQKLNNREGGLNASSLGEIKTKFGGVLQENPELFSLIQQCENCVNDLISPDELVTEVLKAEIQLQSGESLKKATSSRLRSGEAARENQRIRQSAPRRRSSRSGASSFQQFSLEQDLLLPRGQ